MYQWAYLHDIVYPEETYSPVKEKDTDASNDWKRRLEEASVEVEAISDDSFQHAERFGMDEASLLRLAHSKLPYFHSVRELQQEEYDFRFDAFLALFVAFDQLFKVSKRTKTVEQQEPRPAK